VKIVFLDFETYYDDEYSLRKITPVEYVLDPRFECIGCAIQEGLDGEPYWLDGPELPAFFARLKASGERVMLVSHNALFDMCLVAWIFHFIPELFVCTLSVSRSCLGHLLRSCSLASVAKHLGLGVKGDAIIKVKGMTAAMIRAAGLMPGFIDYALQDVRLCAGIFKELVHSRIYPTEELVFADTVIRCAIEPKFKLDKQLLAEHLDEVQQHKELLLTNAMLYGVNSTKDLMSNEKFADLLRSVDVDPPLKISKTTGKETYAFAKTDEAMIELEEHEDPRVQAFVAARLGHKSTLAESRAQRMISISDLTWPGNPRLDGCMPVPLRVAGAHTHRLCLAGDTSIEVLRSNRLVSTSLDNLRDDDLVWDGDMFVSHGGLSFAGVKEVIEYDGIVGTPDHRVWTVEHGYCQLEAAKARGYDIARGNVPDATRIDPSVRRLDHLQHGDRIHLLPVRQAYAEPVEGSSWPTPNTVPPLQHGAPDGRGSALSGNAGRGHPSEQGEFFDAPPEIHPCCVFNSVGEAVDEGSSKSSERQMAPQRMGDCNGGGQSGTSTVHKPGGIEFSLLRRQGDRVQVSIDRVHGGLVVGQLREPASRSIDRQDRGERTLRAGQSPLGDKSAAGTEPLVVPTWDIVDCGPHNRFMANGRIVHNSGDWKLNMQNLPTRGGSNALRRALIPIDPDDDVFSVDASQIEARVTAWVCGQWDLVKEFADGADVYSNFASDIFGYKVERKRKDGQHAAHGFIGKTGILQLGFGCGAPKFDATVKLLSRAQTGTAIELGEAEAARIVNGYRRRYLAISTAWKTLQNLLPVLANGGTATFGPCTITHQTITGPNGLALHYHDLHFDEAIGEWCFTYGGKPKRIYGGKLLENIVQFLARVAVSQASSRIRARGLKLGLQAHDELVYCVPRRRANEVKSLLLEEMSRRPSWAPDLPLAAEVGSGPSYGDAH
jgi:DNA polymerase